MKVPAQTVTKIAKIARRKYEVFNGNVHVFCFLTEIPILGKCGPEIQNCQSNLVPRLIQKCRT